MTFITDIIICFTLVANTEAQVMLQTCSLDNPLNCPKYSLCTKATIDENEAPKCVCIERFQLNPNWLDEYEDLNTSISLQQHYCLSSIEVSKDQENKLIAYLRSPARREHLAFSILMILLAATLATAVLYGLKVLNLLKRTVCLPKINI